MGPLANVAGGKRSAASTSRAAAVPSTKPSSALLCLPVVIRKWLVLQGVEDVTDFAETWNITDLRRDLLQEGFIANDIEAAVEC